ncbi:MAG: glucokinase [Chloroflexi bacterium]|nr:glucokinase [Chloroflexota bacterium]
MNRENEWLLAGDIGGTKTALAIYARDRGPHLPLAQAVFASKDYESLDALVREFLANQHLNLTRVCIDVAGPVVDQRAQVTNLSWVVDARRLSALLGNVPVCLLNDLEAIANAIPFLESADWETLNEGAPVEHGARAVLAPGTGLGEAFLTWDGEGYRAFPSEGGHADFAPTTALERDLLEYLQERMDHVSYERVASGMGLPNVYAFFKDVRRLREPAWLHKAIAAANDPTPVIVQAALESQVEICVATLNLFVAILGSEAGNLALKVLATGGVYLGGGIPPRILAYLKAKTFLERFTRKGRFAELLRRVPVRVILNPHAALIGAACYGLSKRMPGS